MFLISVALQIMLQIAIVLAGWDIWKMQVILAGISKNMGPEKKTRSGGVVEQTLSVGMKDSA